jgi:hypothetical protein
MTDFCDELKTRLKAVSGVTALVGSGTSARIFHDLLRQGCTLPAVVIYEGGGESYQHLGGISGMVRSVWHVIAYGATRATANALAETIRTKALNSNYRGLFGSTFVNGINCSSHRQAGYDPAQDGTETPRYWTERVYDIFHVEDTT